MKITTHYKRSRARGEDYKGKKSQTVPNEGMTAREVMNRTAVGLPLNGGKMPIYRGDQIYPEFDRLDHSEQFEIIQRVKKELKDRELKAHQDGKAKYDQTIRDKVIEELKKAQEEKQQAEASENNGND